MKKVINFKAALLLIIIALVQTAICQNVQKSSNILVEPEMVFVQGGTFTMGCTSELGEDCYDNEKPAHRVTVSDYYIGKFEVTQVQWKAVMGNNPSSYSGDNLPVGGVNWYDVQEFLSKLNTLTGKSYRLPTEAEWEYAARGGNQSKDYKYSGSNDIDDVAWYIENSGGKSRGVGIKKPNELGICDMSGNLWEWCSDLYGHYENAELTNPKGASLGSLRVFRGGGYYYSAEGSRVSNRDCITSDTRHKYLGFRLALNEK